MATAMSDAEERLKGLGLDDPGAMNLRVLVVEDSEDDAWLLIRELRKACIESSWQRVESEPAMRAALVEPWDVVIADYNIPGFGGLPALCLVQETGYDLPFIIVSGTIGEETAVAAMKAGAHDYLMKGNLARLAPVVRREVREAGLRHARREEELMRQREMLALHAVAKAANEARVVEDALSVSVAQVCRLLGWPLGRGLVLAGEELDAATCAVLWHAERPEEVPLPAGAAAGPVLGFGLAARAVARGEAVWVEDFEADWELSDMARAESLSTAAGLAFPVHLGEKVAAVLEFFNNRPGPPPARVMDLLPQLAGQLARVIERQRGEEEIRRLNTELERRVVTRTNELTVANDELDVFRRSISHDLREPLSRIDGLNQVVIEDYGDRIDSTGRQYLSRAREAAQRMGDLVDNLLEHSRTTRVILRREIVDLSETARAVMRDLQKSKPERQVTITIADGVVALGDRLLLRIVLKNLLGNAWKFTGKSAAPTIEFGAATREGEKAFFVRDNGAGFDMAYAGKLFQAFHRLHAASEFEGNGMGLATAQQSVRRHGGRMWAEGAVGRGATFFFTLPAG
jgi:signal transduction histidine kinase/DNA-binding response OmpR family regulator